MSTGMPMYFPRKAKCDLCSGMKITKTGQDRLLRHWVDRCSDRSRYYVLGRRSAYMRDGLGFLSMWWPWRTYRTGHNRELSDQGHPDGFKGWEVNWSWIEIKSKMRIDLKAKMGHWGPSVTGKEKYGSWQYPPSRCGAPAMQHWQA